MRINLKGSIRSINLPDSFAKGKSNFGGMGQNWLTSFHPREKRDKEDVSITSMYRGRPTDDPDACNFRKLHAEPACLIFARQNNAGCHCEQIAVSIVNPIVDALGNAGNNQLTNREKGIGRPRFCLEKMETLDLAKRKVLLIPGVFQESKAPELPRHLLAEPCLIVSTHTAPIT